MYAYSDFRKQEYVISPHKIPCIVYTHHALSVLLFTPRAWAIYGVNILYIHKPFKVVHAFENAIHSILYLNIIYGVFSYLYFY